MEPDILPQSTPGRTGSPVPDGLGIVGRSPAMRELFRHIRSISRSDVPVLIEGETGVGKCLVARAIHRLSARSNGAFVAVPGQLPEERFELELLGGSLGNGAAEQPAAGLSRRADGGTLFFDEIGDLSLGHQSTLLCFLDRRETCRTGFPAAEVDVRIICATGRDLPEEIEGDRFRRDLYFRLRVVTLRVPTLQERREDLPLLISHLLGKASRKHGKPQTRLTEAAEAALREHDWPGNVRELENEIEQAVLLTPAGHAIEAESFSLGSHSVPLAVQRVQSLDESRRAAEISVITHALSRCGWNVSAAARELDISRVGLTRKLKRLGIRRPGALPAE